MNEEKLEWLKNDIKQALEFLEVEQIEELWCIVCGDNPKYDKGGYGD